MEYILMLWQVLQNIVGLCYLPIAKVSFKEKVGDVYVFETDSRNGSVSLGNLVFISKYTSNYSKTLTHELGHTLQSKVLGPFYLFVIGIPSILWASLRRICRPLRKIDYYWFYTEAWANKWADKYLTNTL
jgi:hypothetical protein